MKNINYIKIIVDEKSIIIKWYLDDIDHVAQKNSRVINYVKRHKIHQIYDVNIISEIIRLKTPEHCNLLINLINLLEYIYGTIKGINSDIYNEIFHGCCLPSITNDTEYYPKISRDDFRILKKIIIDKYRYAIKTSISN